MYLRKITGDSKKGTFTPHLCFKDTYSKCKTAQDKIRVAVLYLAKYSPMHFSMHVLPVADGKTILEDPDLDTRIAVKVEFKNQVRVCSPAPEQGYDRMIDDEFLNNVAYNCSNFEDLLGEHSSLRSNQDQVDVKLLSHEEFIENAGDKMHLFTVRTVYEVVTPVLSWSYWYLHRLNVLFRQKILNSSEIDVFCLEESYVKLSYDDIYTLVTADD